MISDQSHTEKMLDLLSEINVKCRDNGEHFTKKKRLNVLRNKLDDTEFLRTEGDLCDIYHKRSLDSYCEEVLLISSHIDCHKKIHRCFSERISEKKIRGTYDNSITNAAILSLMLEDSVPENVIIAFTGDEECDSGGVREVVSILANNGIHFKCIVLDVTNEGWKEKVAFTVENNFWDDELGQKVIDTVQRTGYKWQFVPENENNIPEYIPSESVVPTSSEADESWEYDEEAIKCFSLCLPVKGEMHSDKGVKARIRSLVQYKEMLKALLVTLA